MIGLDYSKVIDPWLKGLRISVVGFSKIKAGDRVLDVCCGTGDQVFYYAKKGAITYGIDLDSNMIKIAERNKKKLGADNVFFQVANASNLPFEDNFFDCVSISLGLHEKENKTRDKIVSEIRRVVKEGGSLIFIDFRVPQIKRLYFYFINMIESFAGREHYQFFKDYINQGGLKKILEKNQFNIEEKIYVKGGILEIIKSIK